MLWLYFAESLFTSSLASNNSTATAGSIVRGQVVSEGVYSKLGAVPQVQLLKQVGDMRFDGPLADKKLLADFPVAQTPGDKF